MQQSITQFINMFTSLFFVLLASISTCRANDAASEHCANFKDTISLKPLHADPTDCHKYYQCAIFPTEVIGYSRSCAVGTYYLDYLQQCVPEGTTSCVDRCSNNNDVAFSNGWYAGTNCREFFKCSNRYSYRYCCPDTTQFDESTGECVDAEGTCDVECKERGPAYDPAVDYAWQHNATVCYDSRYGTYISSVPGEPNAFMQIDKEGNGAEKQYCSAGTEFSLQSCDCSIFDPNAPPVINNPVTPSRKALLWLPFDDSLKDQSATKFETIAEEVERTAHDSAFGGASLSINNGGYLEAPGFQFFDFQRSGSWCSFFKATGQGGILSNSDGQYYSFVFGVTASGNFRAQLKFFEPTGVRSFNSAFTQAADGWNHFCLTYDGNTAKLFLNGELAESENFAGQFVLSPSSLFIGRDHDLGSLPGMVDDVLITKFAMSDAEVEAHQNGNRAALSDLGYF